MSSINFSIPITGSAGGVGTPGGLDTYVQFNDGGVFGGDADLTYNKTTNTLTSGWFAGSNLSAGSVLFAGSAGVITGSQDHFFFDSSTRRVGIGTTLLGINRLTVSGPSAFTGSIEPGGDLTYDFGAVGKRWNRVFSSAFSGSLTRLSDGTSYLIAGANITITSASNGSVTITSTLSGSYVLKAGQVVVAGSGGLLSGSNNFFWDNANGRVGIGTDSPFSELTVRGTTWSDTVSTNLLYSTNVIATSLTGSLTRLNDGSPYIIGSGSVSVTTGSNGSIKIYAPQQGVSSGFNPGDVIFANSLGEITGSSLFTWDNTSKFLGVGTSYPISALTVGGTTATDVILSNIAISPQISGSLTNLQDGSSYLIASGSISITTGSNGAVTIYAPGSLTNFRPTDVAFANSSGVLTGSSRFTWNNTTPVGVLAVTGSVLATAFSGSLTKLSNGSSYLIAGNNIQIVSGANGAITISSAAGFTPGAIAFADVSGALTGSSTLFSLDPSYNTAKVGINTDAPNYALDVKGSIGVSGVVWGNIYFGDRYIANSYVTSPAFSGSLTTLQDGSPYLTGGPGVEITTGSNGSIRIAITSTPGGISGYVTASFTNTTSVTVTHNLGIDLYDIEIFDTNRNKIIPKSATATSSTQADIRFGIPTSGYVIIGGPNGATTNFGSGSSGYIARWDTQTTLTNSLIFDAGTGIGIGTTSVGTNKFVVNGTSAFSGSLIPSSNLYSVGSTSNLWSNVYASSLSGSLTSLSDGSPYLRAGGNVVITTGSNGSVIISTSLVGYTTASFLNATNVTVMHNMGLSLYNIEIFDQVYNKIIPKTVTATSPTSADISFGIPTSGYVIVGSPNSSGVAPIITSIPASFTGDGFNQTFTIPSGYSQNSVLVFTNGSYNHPGDDYTISGTNLIFTNIPANGVKIRIRCLTTT